MGKMVFAISKAQEAFNQSNTHRLTGALVLRDAEKKFVAGWLAQYDPTNEDKHVEDKLFGAFEKFRREPAFSTVRNAYLYVYYTPCKDCARKLKDYPALYPTIKWKLAWSVEFTHGKYPTQTYETVLEAFRWMDSLIKWGWKVRRWGFYNDKDDPLSTVVRKNPKELLFGKGYWNKVIGQIPQTGIPDNDPKTAYWAQYNPPKPGT